MPENTYSQLSIYHQRKIILANALMNAALNYLDRLGLDSERLNLMMGATNYAHNLPECEVEAEMRMLDALVAEAIDK